jgi:hypothetical protein
MPAKREGLLSSKGIGKYPSRQLVVPSPGETFCTEAGIMAYAADREKRLITASI